jgi:hypothetical protein
MRAAEFLLEKIVGKLQIDNIEVLVNDHAFDRAKQRGVPHTVVDPVLKKLPKLYSEIESIESGQQFWVYADVYNISIGFRKYDNEGDTIRIVLNTLIADHPGDKINPILEIY